MQIETALAAVSELRDTMVPSRERIQGLLDTMSKMPRATTQFNRARRKYVELLASFVAIHDSSLRVMSEFEATANRVLTTMRGEASASPT